MNDSLAERGSSVDFVRVMEMRDEPSCNSAMHGAGR